MINIKPHDIKRSIFQVLLAGLVITSVLFSSPASAQIAWRRGDFFVNTGGLNNSFSPISIEDKEAADVQNMVLTTGGSIITRDGFDNINSSSTVTATGLKFYQPTSGSKFIVGVFEDDTIKKMDYAVGGGPDGTFDDITGVLSFSVDQNDLSSFAIGEDTLIIEDGIGTTAPYKYTGTGNASALGGSPANATMVAFHKNMAFSAGDSANLSVLSFSDLGDIENWTTGLSGNVGVENEDGSIIRAIEPGFDSLYIWKDFSIWRLSGEDKDNFVLQRMVQGIGCTSPNCASLVGNDFIFFDSKGDVYLYDGGIKVRLISSKIEGTTSQANFSRFDKISSVEFEKDYYVSFSSSSSATNDTVMMFDTFHLAWLKFDGMNVNAMEVGQDSNGKDAIFFSDYGGFVQQFPSGTNDDGTAIDAFYLTKQFRFPEIQVNKTFQELYIYAGQKGNYDINVELRPDLQSSGTTQNVNLSGSGSLWGTAIYGVDTYGGQNLITGILDFAQEGKFFQLNFSNSNLDEPIDIKGWSPFIQGDDTVGL